jgi:hypothetical protein
MQRIYSDLRGEVLTTEMGEKKIYFYDTDGSRRNPSLILYNILEVEKVRDYLNEVLDKYKSQKPVDTERK